MIFTFLSVYCLVSTVLSCPDNCYCDEFVAECTLETCNDEIDTEYEFLRIKGTLCETQREILSSIKDNTEVILYDDVCGDIPNCR